MAVTCPEGTTEWERVYKGRREVTCRNDRGLAHGPVVAKDAEDGEMVVGEYHNGERAGRWFVYGGANSQDYHYEYRQGTRVADWRYFDAPDQPIEAMHFNQDYDAHGAWITWYRNGQKRHERHYTDGRATGVWRQWNEDGELLDETNFDAVPAGEFVEYDWLRPDGSIRVSGAYLDGLPVGSWTWRESAGGAGFRILQECDYEAGELIDCWKEAEPRYPLPM